MSPAGDTPAAIGRYRIDGLLGRGAMGVVYRGYDPEIERPVAIKLVRADLLGGESREQYLQRFRREAQAAGRCSHANIVGLHDVSVDATGNPFLVMEYVAGASLDRLLAHVAPDRRGQAFTVEQVTSVGLQVLDALACAHGLGVVHRDIKPANILLLDGPQAGLRVKVTDFGISRLIAHDITQVGLVIGTPSYMSPEQCRGDDAGPQSDLFSVASVLYEMLSGHKAFTGTSIGALTARLVGEAPPPIPDLPPRVQAVLNRAHAKRPEDRFPSAAAMADALRSAARVADAPGPAIAAETFTVVSALRADGATPVEPGAAREVERLLADYVGPLARHLVQRALEQAGSADAFARSLAAGIEDGTQRDAFLRRAKAALRGSASAFRSNGQTQPAGQPGASIIPADAQERIARDLARHIGPIAPLLVRRTAPTAFSVEQLRAVLAMHIDDEAERRAFIAGQ